MMRKFLTGIERFLIVAAIVAAFVAMVGVKHADLAVSIGAGIFALLCGGGIHLVQMAIARRDVAIQQVPKTAPVLPAKIYYTQKYAPLLAVGTIVFALFAYGAFDLGRQGSGIVFSFMGIVGLISFLKTVVRNGQPALVIDESGIVANNYGLIPWSIIERVLVSFNNSSSFHHELHLWLSDFEKIRSRQGLLVKGTQWLGMPIGGNSLRIRIGGLSHGPAYIDAAVKNARSRFAESIGVSVVSGDLSFDRLSSENDRALNALHHEDGVAKLRKESSKIERLLQKSVDESSVIRHKSRVTALLLLTVVIVFIGWLVVKTMTK